MTVIVFDPTEALSTALGKEAEAMFIIHGADEEPMWETLVALQTAYRSSAGRIVLILPTIGVAGAAGAVDCTTAIEGIRVDGGHFMNL